MTSKILSLKQPHRSFVIEALKTARQELLYAQRMYNEAIEPELIDYVTYLIKAREIHYIYLLRQARQEGLCLLPNDIELIPE